MTLNTDIGVSRAKGTMDGMDNQERMTTWCRMWSEDPALAYALMTGRCVQWSGQTGGLDGVVGPASAVEFMTAYRAQHVNVFTPRVLADGGDSFAYVWDVATPDGRILTGFDANIVRNGSVDQNWTFVGPHINVLDNETGDTDTSSADAGALSRLAVEWLRTQAPGAAAHRAPIADASRGRVAVLWTQGRTGNAALLVVRDAKVTRAFPFAGTRAFRY